MFGKDGKGISFKNTLKGHINWRKPTFLSERLLKIVIAIYLCNQESLQVSFTPKGPIFSWSPNIIRFYYQNHFIEEDMCFDKIDGESMVENIDIRIKNKIDIGNDIPKLCDGIMCGDKTLDSLPQGYKNMLFTRDRITEIQRLIEKTETTDKLRPEGVDINTQFHHDNDKCCPTLNTMIVVDFMKNIHGELKEIVRFKDRLQPIAVGKCVNVAWGCTNCKQKQRLHFLLAMDIQTKDIILDLFYVNSYCTCVQK